MIKGGFRFSSKSGRNQERSVLISKPPHTHTHTHTHTQAHVYLATFMCAVVRGDGCAEMCRSERWPAGRAVNIPSGSFTELSCAFWGNCFVFSDFIELSKQRLLVICLFKSHSLPGIRFNSKQQARLLLGNKTTKKKHRYLQFTPEASHTIACTRPTKSTHTPRSGLHGRVSSMSRKHYCALGDRNLGNLIL